MWRKRESKIVPKKKISLSTAWFAWSFKYDESNQEWLSVAVDGEQERREEKKDGQMALFRCLWWRWWHLQKKKTSNGCHFLKGHYGAYMYTILSSTCSRKKTTHEKKIKHVILYLMANSSVSLTKNMLKIRLLSIFIINKSF